MIKTGIDYLFQVRIKKQTNKVVSLLKPPQKKTTTTTTTTTHTQKASVPKLDTLFCIVLSNKQTNKPAKTNKQTKQNRNV